MDTIAPNPKVEAIRHHYEVSNEFYRLLLGPSMMYSGAYWHAGEDRRATLDVAQDRRLDAFAELANAQGAAKVLDLGCGWGTMLRRLVDVHGAERAVGVTLSRTQAEWIASFGNPKVEARVESWEDHRTDEPYDAMFCINALEHFVNSSLAPRERVKRYRYFFRHCQNLLKPGGRFVTHIMTVDKPPLRKDILDDLKFLLREEFEGCHVPHLHEITAAIEGVFEITELQQDRDAFGGACRVWLEHLADRRDEAVAMQGEEVVARFERYLDVFAYMFEDGWFNNLRITFTRKN
jgi:cyclopropane-fatty-acyl-phospholipid synthase